MARNVIAVQASGPAFQYNCRTGQVTSFTDVNSKVTGMTYADPLDRITAVTSPDGLGVRDGVRDEHSGTWVTKDSNHMGYTFVDLSSSSFLAVGRLVGSP